MCGMYFALRSGKEHRNLQSYQIELFEPKDLPPYLVYHESFSKNNTGGIAQRNANTMNPSRCFVRLYKKYTSHWPDNRKSTAFYLTALKKP